MSIFVTADLHLGHDAIRRLCARPFETLEEMDETLISNWNACVSRRDLVYILGDFAWKFHDKYLARLKGKKILIRGNHDRMSQEKLRNFTEVHDLLVRNIDGQRIVFCHYCLASWPSSGYGSWHLHGHSHGRIKETAGSLRCDVGVDVWDYSPVPWEAIEAKLGARRRELPSDMSELDRNVIENLEQNREIMRRLPG
jgi:calcineurin-like phosphoesterase family protein